MKKKGLKYGPMMMAGGVGVMDDEYYMSGTLRSNAKGNIIYYCLKLLCRLILEL